MAETGLYAELILPLLLERSYTYQVPESLRSLCEPGRRAIAQFGKTRFYTALIVGVSENPPPYPAKALTDIIDDQPVVVPGQVEFWKWIAGYYLCSLGEVMKAALPSGLKLESETRIRLAPGFDDPDALNEKERLIFRNLQNTESLSVDDVAALLDQKSAAGLLRRLIDRQVVYAGEELTGGWKPKMTSFIQLGTGLEGEEAIRQAFDRLARAPEQLRLLMGFLSESGHLLNGTSVPLSKSDLLARTGVSQQVLQSLVKKGLLTEELVETDRLDFHTRATQNLKELSEAQAQALAEVRTLLEQKGVCLLHGVTSSGKTELYFHLIRETMEAGRQVLFMLPEIALTTQMISRVKEVFGSLAGVYHSKFPDAERVEVWRNLLGQSPGAEPYQLVLGVRSSLFLPFRNLGLIIVDEEQEPSFKQFHPAPRYHARDAALWLARQTGARTLLGTATPSLETYANCRAGRYGLVNLPVRHLDMQLPAIVIADQKMARKRRQMRSVFTPELYDAMTRAFEAGEQVILFQNRRGFAPYMECPTCGWVVRCDHCDVSLTYHRSVGALVCHYCSSVQPVPQQCLACGEPGMLARGIGTERIEEETRLLFPNQRVERMDVDSTRSRQAFERLITAFEKGEIQVLVGTQMVSKGLDFDRVSVVGILDADSLLNYPDFRAYERSYHLMSQVAGRAGRKGRQGLVIIQTSSPEHPIIRQVVETDYPGMFRDQSLERHQYGYPPYTRLVMITLRHRSIDLVNQGAHWFASGLRALLHDRVVGPDFPLVPRIQNNYLKNILVKIERDRSPGPVKDLIYQTWIRMKGIQELKSLQVSFDVDPM